MTGNPIGDGFGGFLDDGFGAQLLDGYPAASGPSPFQPRIARIIADHFQPAPLRRHRTRATPTPATSPTRPPYRSNRVVARHLDIIASHFGRPRYPGARHRSAFYYPGATGQPARASQLVVEALVTTAAAARTSQLDIEVLAYTSAPARASQLTLESLVFTACQVRASQLVLEVIVPGAPMPTIPVYPVLEGLTFSVIKRVKGSVGAGVATSGREIRVNYWSIPQFEWDLTYAVLADNGASNGTTYSDIQTLMGFVLNRAGSFSPFYFRDDTDYQVTGQALGIGDGMTKSFAAVRTYGLGDVVSTQPVGSVNTNVDVAVYLDGVIQEPSSYTVDTSTPCANAIIFNTAPTAGAVVTADFDFYWFCRFKDDVQEFENTMQNLWQNNKITIFSLKS